MSRMMFLLVSCLTVLAILSVSVEAAPKAAKKADAEKIAKAEPTAKVESPAPTLQEQADVLQVKTNAMMSLTELLTDRRARSKKRVDRMTAYLKSIGKLEAYENADTPALSPKGEMTFRQACNLAVKHAKEQGGACVDAVDDEETRMLKRVFNANKRLAKKAWDEFVALRNQTRSMGAYLESIGKVDAYKKWAGVETEKQAKAYEKATQADRAKGVAAYKKRKVAQQKKREQIAARDRQDRQESLRRRFELRQQRLYNNMRERTPAQGYNGWGGWGDSYDDVHHRRRYYR